MNASQILGFHRHLSGYLFFAASNFKPVKRTSAVTTHLSDSFHASLYSFYLSQVSDDVVDEELKGVA